MSNTPKAPEVTLSKPEERLAKFRHLLDAIYVMNRGDDRADFASAVLDGMSRLISADFVNIHVLNPGSGRLINVIVPENPYTESEVAYYRAHSEENPLVAYYHRTQDTRSRRMSDVVTRKEYLSSGVYLHCNARIGIRHVLALPIQVDHETVAGMTFSRRRRDFSEEDCEMLDAFAPHFLMAWRKCPNPWTVVDSGPHPVCQHFRDHLVLTNREADVLYWITEGKQNGEISVILNISSFTVQKHVSNILRKTGMENRHALAIHALRLRSG